MYAQSCHPRKRTEEAPGWKIVASGLLEGVELLIGGLCCVVTTSYTMRVEQNGDSHVGQVSHKLSKSPLFPVSKLIADRIYLQMPVQIGSDNLVQRMTFLITNPGPETVLGSCLAMGCCLSLYAHQRQERDRYQSVVFLVLVTWAVMLGKRLGASPNMVALGYVPWALCVAMLLSYVGHALARGVSGRRKQKGEHRANVSPPSKS